MGRSVIAGPNPLPRVTGGGRLVRNDVRDSLPGGAVIRSEDKNAKLARSVAGGIENVCFSTEGGGGVVRLVRSLATLDRSAEGGGGGQLCRSLGAGGGQL